MADLLCSMTGCGLFDGGAHSCGGRSTHDSRNMNPFRVKIVWLGKKLSLKRHEFLVVFMLSIVLVKFLFSFVHCISRVFDILFSLSR